MSRAITVMIRRGLSLVLLLGLSVLLFADLAHFRTGGSVSPNTFAIDQRFHRGDGPTALSNIFISCNALVITDVNNLQIIIPPSGGSGSNFEFDDVLPHATLGGPNLGLVTAPSATGLATSFPDAGTEKTFFLNTLDFAAGNNFTVNGLRVRNFTATSPPAHLTLNVGGGTFNPRLDTAWIMVANDPTVTLPGGAPAPMSPGNPSAPLGQIRIRECNVTPGLGEPFNGAIWTSRDLRLTITGGTNVTWDTSSPVSVDFPGKVSTAFVYTEDGNGKTVRIPIINADFAQNEAVTITGLRFNVASNAPDGPFNIDVRCGGASNFTAHAQLVGQCTVQGLPTMTSSGASLFTVGDPPSTSQTITVTESGGSPKITAAGDVRINIPNGFGMQWDATGAAPTAVLSGAGTGAINPTCIIEGVSNKTLRVDVTTNLSANQVITISGARFAQFSTREPADGFLQLEVGAIAGPEAVDARGLRISQPTIQSANDHVFIVGQGAASTVQTITLTEDALNTRIVNGTQIRLRLPATSIAFAGTNPTVSGNLGGPITFEDPVTGGFQTMRVTASATLGTGGTATISNIPVVVGSPALVSNFQLFMSASAVAQVTSIDPALLVVGSLPTLSSAAQQFTVNDPSDGVINLASTITIGTNAGSAPLFQNGNSLEIVIPPALNMEWRTSVQPTSITGGASGKVTGPVTFPGVAPFKTLRLPITADWAANDSLILAGLQFANFSAASAPPNTSLQLRVRVGGPFAATDANPKAIGAPTILSGANQVFGKTDPATTMSPIVITEDAVTPRIGNASAFVRVRIPTGFNMTWGTAPTAVVGGPGVGAVGTPFIESPRVVRIPVSTAFSGGQTLTLTNGTFIFNGSISGLDNLELEVNGTASLIPNAFDTRTILVGTRPSITSIFTGDNNGGSPNGAIDRVILIFDENINASSLSATTGLGFTVTGFNISLAAVVPPLPNNVLILSIAETGLADSSLTPTVFYDPLVGDLFDLDDVLEMTQAPPATQDGASPIIVGISTSDTNGNGFLNQVRLTFSEPLAGTPDITRFILVDADGQTDLLAGATLVINGSTLEINLSDTIGTTGTPRFQYRSTGPGGVLTDAAGNAVPTLTNNTPPVANAGPNQTVIPSVVTLNGSASFDPDGAQTLSYLWSEVSRPAGAPAILFTNPTSSIASFIPRTAGAYVVSLRVSDLISSSTQNVIITVLNVAPVSDTLIRYSNVAVGATPFLRGVLSTDVNGDLDYLAPNTPLWSVVRKPATSVATFASPTVEAFPGFIPDVPGTYELSFLAKDIAGNPSAVQSVFVTASGGGVIPPAANAGPDVVVPVGTQVTLNGSQSWSQNPGATNYLWTRPDSTTSLGTTITFTPPGVGLYTFKLVLTDTTPANPVDSAPDFVTVMAYNPSNLPPVAFASKLSPAGTPVLGQAITLDSTGSLDPEGAPLSYSWTQLAGPTASLSNPAAAKPTFAPALAGTYEFQLVVFDGTQLSFPSNVVLQVLVDNTATPITLSPSVTGAPGDVAGHLMAGSPVTLVHGTLTPGITNWWWEQVSGPTVTFPGDNTLDQDPAFTPTAAGTYVFRLTALQFSPPSLFPQLSTILIVVVDEPGVGNDAPDANAGANQTGVAAGATVTLNGGGSSANTTTYFWAQLAGPPVALSDPHAAQPTFTAVGGVTYVFQLVVTTASGAASAPSIMNVVVDAAPVATGPTGGGGGGGGCGLTFEPLIFLALIAWARRRSR